jgi:hypothetical protein
MRGTARHRILTDLGNGTLAVTKIIQYGNTKRMARAEKIASLKLPNWRHQTAFLNAYLSICIYM